MSGHHFLTILAPIDHRSDDPDGRIRAIRQALAAPGIDAFRRCPMVHTARFHVLDKVGVPEGAAPSSGLTSAYLLFVAEIDGDEDDFVDCLYRTGREFVEHTFGQCLGYPRHAGAVFFRRFVRTHAVRGGLWYTAFPHSVATIRRAMQRAQRLLQWVESGHGAPGPALRDAWNRLRLELRRTPASGGACPHRNS
jgi:hypothetical protein